MLFHGDLAKPPETRDTDLIVLAASKGEKDAQSLTFRVKSGESP